MKVPRSLSVAVLIAAMILGAALVACRPWATRLETIKGGGAGPPTFVLLHGYGSTPESWKPFTTTITFPPHGQFVFPRGPETTVPPDGPVGGRAWWRLDLAAHIPPGQTVPDLSATEPDGILSAAALVRTLLRDLSWWPRGPVVLGGFSQGAMVASEVAFMADDDLRALVLMSGTTVNEPKWDQALAHRRGLPVFMSHGRNDDILPFEVADRFRRKLESAGLRVTWLPFDGGHDVPQEVVVGLNAFLKNLPLEK